MSFTHVTVDEIAATPDLGKRRWLLNLLVFLGRPILTSGAVANFSRANFCRVMAGDDGTFEPLRSGNIKHSRDALIAHTALHEGCALVTNEKRLAAGARKEGRAALDRGLGRSTASSSGKSCERSDFRIFMTSF